MRIRELLRKPLASAINLLPGDSVTLHYREAATDPDGNVVNGTTTQVAQAIVDQTYSFTEALIFEAAPGELGAGRALGGVLIENGETPD
jgi:hypothetical protein